MPQSKGSTKKQEEFDWNKYGEDLKKRLDSPEGRKEREWISVCSRAALERFKRSESVDSQLLREPMTF